MCTYAPRVGVPLGFFSCQCGRCFAGILTCRPLSCWLACAFPTCCGLCVCIRQRPHSLFEAFVCTLGPLRSRKPRALFSLRREAKHVVGLSAACVAPSASRGCIGLEESRLATASGCRSAELSAAVPRPGLGPASSEPLRGSGPSGAARLRAPRVGG